MTHCNRLLVHFLLRRRDDGMQAHRGSFVATPTAELSNQEEMLLGDILDWSLDSSCSGYEGDQEEDSEGDKDGDGEYEKGKGLGIFIPVGILVGSKVMHINELIYMRRRRIMHELLFRCDIAREIKQQLYCPPL